MCWCVLVYWSGCGFVKMSCCSKSISMLLLFVVVVVVVVVVVDRIVVSQIQVVEFCLAPSLSSLSSLSCGRSSTITTRRRNDQSEKDRTNNRRGTVAACETGTNSLIGESRIQRTDHASVRPSLLLEKTNANSTAMKVRTGFVRQGRKVFSHHNPNPNPNPNSTTPVLYFLFGAY